MAYNTINDLFKATCDNLRNKLGTTEKINHQDIPLKISMIKTSEELDVYMLHQQLLWVDSSYELPVDINKNYISFCGALSLGDQSYMQSYGTVDRFEPSFEILGSVTRGYVWTDSCVDLIRLPDGRNYGYGLNVNYKNSKPTLSINIDTKLLEALTSQHGRIYGYVNLTLVCSNDDNWNIKPSESKFINIYHTFGDFGW